MKRRRLPELRDAPRVGEPGEHRVVVRASRRGARPPRRPLAAPRPPRLGLRLVGSSGVGFGLRARFAARRAATGSPRSHVTVPPAASIFSFAVFEKQCAEHRELLRELADAEDLDVDRDLADQPLRLERLRRHVRRPPRSAPRGRGGSRAGCRCGTGRSASRPRTCCRGASPSRMSIGIWPPSKPAAHLVRAGAGLLALDPAARVAALARAEAAPDPLAVLARLGRRQSRMEVELVHALRVLPVDRLT